MKTPSSISEGIWREDLFAIVNSPRLWLYAALMVLAPTITFVSLRALGSIVPAACVVLIALFFLQHRRLPVPSIGLVGIWFAFLALVASAAVVAVDSDYAWGRVGKLAMFSFSALMIWTCAQQGKLLRPLKTVLVGAMGFAIMFGLMEGLTDGWFFLLTHELTSAEAKLAANRPLVVLALMIWPVMLILVSRAGGPVMALFLLATLVASFTTDSQSSQLGLLAGSLVFVAARVFPRAVGWGCLVVGIVAILGMPFFFALVDLRDAVGQSKLAVFTILPRLELWGFVGTKIIEVFPFGYGLEAGRSISIAEMKQTYFIGDSMHHPHNGVLQIWLEFGLLGAIAAALLWAALLKRIIDLDGWSSTTSLAGAVCFLTIASVSHGVWQSWWVSALALVPYLFAVAMVQEKQ
ncbi:MAG: O-antigen ligase family protein [Rhodobiaceae bacterium]|nr:O-antigen ligase family protein [Rhodobiaceae bacterium]